jgi:hypothetical protein
MAVAIAIFTYPVVRGLTERISGCRRASALGAGNLASRVAIGRKGSRGRREASRAAARIEEAVGAHRLLLPPPHELRTPYRAFILGIELFVRRRNADSKTK